MVAGALAAGAHWPGGAVGGALVLGGAAAAAAEKAPEHRWQVLKLAVAALLAALVLSLGVPGWAAALTGVLAFVFLPAQPALFDRLQLPFVARARAERRIALGAGQLWEALFPRETAEHWDPAIEQIRPASAPDVCVYVYRPLGDAPRTQIPVRIFDVEPERHFKLRDLSLPHARAGGPVTVTSFVIEPDGAGSCLTVMEASWRQGLWSAFAFWLDDHLEDHVDSVAALLEGRPDQSVRGALHQAARAQRAGRTKPTRS